jgi:hypothetical protein
LEGENPMSDLNWLFLAMALLKALFSASENLLEDGNLISTIGHRRRLYTVSFLEASLLKKLDFWCCIGGISVAAIRN